MVNKINFRSINSLVVYFIERSQQLSAILLYSELMCTIVTSLKTACADDVIIRY